MTKAFHQLPQCAEKKTNYLLHDKETNKKWNTAFVLVKHYYSHLRFLAAKVWTRGTFWGDSSPVFTHFLQVPQIEGT